MTPSASTKSGRVATSLRLSQLVYRQLKLVSESSDVPINTLVERALSQFLPGKLAEIEQRATSLVDAVRALKASDPDGELALQARIAAETAMDHDPAEGTLAPGSTARQPRPRRRTRDDIFAAPRR